MEGKEEEEVSQGVGLTAWQADMGIKQSKVAIKRTSMLTFNR